MHNSGLMAERYSNHRKPHELHRQAVMAALLKVRRYEPGDIDKAVTHSTMRKPDEIWPSTLATPFFKGSRPDSQNLGSFDLSQQLHGKKKARPPFGSRACANSPQITAALATYVSLNTTPRPALIR
jgi:hypothetical protein